MSATIRVYSFFVIIIFITNKQNVRYRTQTRIEQEPCCCYLLRMAITNTLTTTVRRQLAVIVI